MICPYDTETTGLVRKNLPLTDVGQPRLVQLSCLIADEETHRITQSMNLVVKPEGWDIPDEASAVHGITTEYATEVGLPEKHVLDTFLWLWDGKKRISHNNLFDDKVIECAIARYYSPDSPLLEAWQKAPTYCTMRESKEIVQAKGKTGRLKFPKLAEAYEYFFNEVFDNQHSANADTVACFEIYLALQQRSEYPSLP